MKSCVFSSFAKETTFINDQQPMCACIVSTTIDQWGSLINGSFSNMNKVDECLECVLCDVCTVGDLSINGFLRSLPCVEQWVR